MLGQRLSSTSRPTFNRSALKCTQVQRYSMSANTWYNPIDITDGPGIITGIWMATTDDTNGRVTPMTFEFDGGPGSGGARIGADPASPANVSDLLTGEIFGSGFDFPVLFRGPIVGVTNAYAAGEGAPGIGFTGFSGYIRLLMPYYSSFKLHIYAEKNSSAFIMVERMPLNRETMNKLGLDWGMYLRTYGDGLAENIRQQRFSAYAIEDLFDEAGPVYLAGLWMFLNNGWANGSNSWKPLEGDIRIHYDNEGTPSYRCSGLEDFFYSSWYFQEIEETDNPFSGIFDNSPQGQIIVPFKVNDDEGSFDYTMVCARYFSNDYMPYAKTNLQIQWQNGEENQGYGAEAEDTYVRWLVWYYK